VYYDCTFYMLADKFVQLYGNDNVILSYISPQLIQHYLRTRQLLLALPNMHSSPLIKRWHRRKLSTRAILTSISTQAHIHALWPYLSLLHRDKVIDLKRLSSPTLQYHARCRCPPEAHRNLIPAAPSCACFEFHGTRYRLLQKDSTPDLTVEARPPCSQHRIHEVCPTYCAAINAPNCHCCYFWRNRSSDMFVMRSFLLRSIECSSWYCHLRKSCIFQSSSWPWL